MQEANHDWVLFICQSLYVFLYPVENYGAGDMAQPAKHLLYEHAELSLIPRTHIIKLSIVGEFVIPAPGKQGLAGQLVSPNHL